MISRALAIGLTRKKFTTQEVVNFLTTYNLLSLVPTLTKELELLQKKEKESELVTIESPFPLSKENVTKIKSFVSDTELVHEVKENKDLLAGFRATYKGIRYERSARHIINEFLQ